MNFSLPGIVEGNLESLIEALHNIDYEARIENLVQSQKG
jgi:hypothetical protein